MFNLKSTLSNKLTYKVIKEICFLKDKQWRYGIKLQLKWFKNNIKKNDLHNLFYINSKLIGYTLLRKRTYKYENLNNKIQYLLLDTLILDKKFRSRKLSSLLMNFNNEIIKYSGLSSFLTCEDELVDFYKKNNWKKLNKNKFNIGDNIFTSNGMIYNRIGFNKKCIFYINK